MGWTALHEQLYGQGSVQPVQKTAVAPEDPANPRWLRLESYPCPEMVSGMAHDVQVWTGSWESLCAYAYRRDAEQTLCLARLEHLLVFGCA